MDVRADLEPSKIWNPWSRKYVWMSDSGTHAGARERTGGCHQWQTFIILGTNQTPTPFMVHDRALSPQALSCRESLCTHLPTLGTMPPSRSPK